MSSRDESEVKRKVKLELLDKALASIPKVNYIVEILKDGIAKERKGKTVPQLAVIELIERDDDSVYCPYCGGRATFLRTLNRYYCFNCKRFVD